MEPITLLQIIISISFISIILILFKESKDYLTYSLIFLVIIAVSAMILTPPGSDAEAEEAEIQLLQSIDWEVVVFLFCLFTIVEILNEKKVFHQIALLIVNKYHDQPRKMFYILSITSTLIATVIEDLSVAIIFIPIVIEACKKMDINPTPYMYGVTICINLASTLTPFGSAENIIIANQFDLSLLWHLIYLGVYFVIALIITLYLLDKIILTRQLKKRNIAHSTYSIPGYFSVGKLERDIQREKEYSKKIRKSVILRGRKEEELEKIIEVQSLQNSDLFVHQNEILKLKINKKEFKKNMIGLIIFIIMLTTITSIILSGLLGLIMFVLLNPIKIDLEGNKEPSLSTYIKRIDAKLIYFFIILFLMVHYMKVAKITAGLEQMVENLASSNIFLISIGILFITSLLSGLLDDAPITILFLPIIADLITHIPSAKTPLLIAFTLGINLGGNFLPQGAACDMMTLDLARKHKVEGFTYKNFTIVGGFFALLHIFLGVIYIYIFLLFFS